MDVERPGSVGGYAAFEARVRQRRIDQRIGVVRAAIRSRRFPEALEALDELGELDPALPAIGELAAELAAVRRTRRRRLVVCTALVSAVAGAVLGVQAAHSPRAAGRMASLEAHAIVPPDGRLTIASPVVTPIETPEPPPVSEAQNERERPVVERTQPAPAVPRLGDAGADADAALIREVLQRYRRAYNGLDVQLAHAVYPGADEAALAHAFDDLRSQSLEFDVCTLDTLEDSARAVCRGSARYVPRAGSGSPRAERRVWTFRLAKNNNDWTITSAWTER